MAQTKAHEDEQHRLSPVLLWSCDAAGRCTWVNDEWLRFTGQDAQDIRGAGWLDAVVAEDRNALDDVFVAALASHEPFEARYRLRRHDGALRRMLDRGGPVFEDGELVGWAGGSVDVEDHQRLAEAHALLDAFFRNSAAGIAVIDSDLRFVRVNDEFAAMQGERVSIEIGGRIDEEIEDPVAAAQMAELVRRVLRTGAPERNVLVSGDGTRHLMASYSPIAGPDGPTAIGLVVNDITDQVRVEEDRQELRHRASLLAETAEVLESTHEPDAILVDLARVLASRLGDWCVIDVIDPDGTGELVRIASAHHDGASALHVDRVARVWTADPDRDAGPGHVLRTGHAELISVVTSEALRSLTGGGEERHLLAGLELRSLLCVPLAARGVTLGVITLATLGTDWELDSTDLTLAADIGRRAGLAVDNARLHAAVQSQHGLYETLLRAQSELGEGYVLLSADRIIYCNTAAEEIAGRRLQNLRELGSLFELLPPEEHRRVTNWAYGVWQGDATAANLETVVLRPDGTRVEVEAGAFPLRSEDQETQVVCVLRDIGERKRREAERLRLLRRTSLLNAVAQALEQSLELVTSMRDVTALVTQELADYASVDVISRDERTVERVAVSCRDPREHAIAAALATFPVRLDTEHPAAVAVRTGTPVFFAVDEDSDRSVAQDDAGHLAAVRRARVVRVGALPLIAGSRRLGALSLGWTTDGPPPVGHDLELLEALARRIALGVSNGLLYQERELVASSLQRSLLPPELPALDAFEVAARYEPADRASEVGGDFYDLFPCDTGRWALIVGDVCGKGADAAALTAMSRYTLRASFLEDNRSPARALALLNRAMQRENDPERFLTAVMGVVDDPVDGVSRMTLSVAGHPAPIVLRADGSADLVTATGPVVGVFDHATWREVEVELRSGDVLILYTDGVTEASRTAPLIERELATRIAMTRPASAEQAASAVERVARRRSGGALRDDLVVVAVRMR